MTQLHFPVATHRDDPRTSLEAELEMTVSGRRATHARAVLDAVRGRSGLTAEHYGELTGLGRVEAARRLSDLKDDGLVYRDGRMRYHGTGQSLWFPVSAR